MKTKLLDIFSLSFLMAVLGMDVTTLRGQGVDTLATINSFAPVGEFYQLDYSGDYSAILDWMDEQILGGKRPEFGRFNCSLFSANGEGQSPVFGRNFDNDPCDVLFARYSPPGAYASIAFTRMSDMGFPTGTNFENLTFSQKMPLLYAACFPPDGVNEYGLTAGLAYVPAVTVAIDPMKDTIFITHLIREILDHAQTPQEAFEIAKSYNVFDQAVNRISHHVLVGSPGNGSLILEYVNGQWMAFPTQTSWQVVTNTAVYNMSIEDLRNACWRYNTLYTILEENHGALSWDMGMLALDQAHVYCPWSAVYDMINPAAFIAINNNYSDIAWVDLENFDFTVYVGTSYHNTANSSRAFAYPNPFCHEICFNTGFPIGTTAEIKIFNISGKEIKSGLVSQESGGEGISWDGTDHLGNICENGVYLAVCEGTGYKSIIRLVLAR